MQLVGRGVDTWDSIDALLTFTDSSTATLHSAWVLPRSFPSVFDLRLETTDAVHRSLATGERVTFDPSATGSTSPFPTETRQVGP